MSKIAEFWEDFKFKLGIGFDKFTTSNIKISEIDPEKYAKVVFPSVRAKKEWFKTLFIYLLNNKFESVEEIEAFLADNNIEKKEFESCISDYIEFSMNCHDVFSGFQVAEIEKLAKSKM